MSDPPVTIPPPDPAVVPAPELVPPSAVVVQEAVRSAPTPAEIAPAPAATASRPAPASTPAEPAQVPKPETPPAARKDNPEKAGGPLWLRRWNLSVGSNAGNKAVDLSALAFEFQVEKALNSTP